MRHALETPGMRDILLETRTTVIQPASGSAKRIALRSTNKMLWRDDLHVIGKTGWTRAGQALLRRRRVGDRPRGDHRRARLHAICGATSSCSPPTGSTRPRRIGALRSGYQVAAAPRLDPARLRRAGARWPRRRRTACAAVRPLRPLPRARASSLPTNARRRSLRAAAAPQGDREDVGRANLRYHLQLGSWKSKVRADQLRQQLAKRGYRASVERVAGTYRVTVRDFGSRDAARKAARSLKRTLRVEPVIAASR